MAIEELPLKRIRTDVGDVAEYSSFRDGMNALAMAIIDLRDALQALDRKVVRDLNALDGEIAEAKRHISELRKAVEELPQTAPASIEERIKEIGKLVEEKVLPIIEALEGLQDVREELSRAVRLIRFLNLRVEHLEARVAGLEEEVRRLRVLALGGLREVGVGGR